MRKLPEVAGVSRAASLVGIAALSMGCNLALAGDGTQNPDALAGSGSPPPAVASMGTVNPAPAANPYARYAQYLIKGWNISWPDPSNFVDQDPYGMRSRMADAGLFLYGFSNNTFTYDTRNGNQLYGTAQTYSGEKPTIVANQIAYLTYDLGNAGLPGGQLSAGMAYAYVNWDPAGPTHAHVGNLQYFQSLLGGKAELTIGYVGNSIVYNGVYIGGNPAGGTFGVNANIPQEVGQSHTLNTRPGINFKTYLGGGFYNISGIQRSWNPGGAAAEIKDNGIGLGWSGPNVGELFQDEIGYQRTARPGLPYTWLRADYAFNNSNYASLKTPGTRENNHFWTFLADRQIWQMGDTPASAYRGLYAGLTVMEAPPQVNRFSQYFEARLYMRGPFASRPRDSMTLVLNQNRFSKYAIAQAETLGQMTDGEATTASMGYTANVYHGIFVTCGLSYIDHPRAITTVPQQKSALTTLANVVLFY